MIDKIDDNGSAVYEQAEIKVTAKGLSKKRSWLGKYWRLSIVVIVIGSLVWLGKGYLDAKKELKKLSNPKESAQNETQTLITQIGRTVELPAGEAPTLATVNDATRLKNQEFFKDAQNGDKVLIYSKAGKAILYRPSSKKTIQAAPISPTNIAQ